MHAARGHARTKKSGPVHGRSSLGRGVRGPRRARWASLDGGDTRSKPQVCHCGAPNCKGFIGESDDAQGESAEVTHIPEFPLVTTAPATAADGAPSTTPVPSGKVGTLPGPPRPTGAVIPRLPPPPLRIISGALTRGRCRRLTRGRCRRHGYVVDCATALVGVRGRSGRVFGHFAHGGQPGHDSARPASVGGTARRGLRAGHVAPADLAAACARQEMVRASR